MPNSTGNLRRCYANDAEIEDVVRGFESGETPLSEFDHCAHLTVAAWYLLNLPFAEAHERLRANLLRVLKRHGIEGYNETVTLFWLKRVGEQIQNAERDRRAFEIVNQVLEFSGDSRIIYEYYTKEQLTSREARGGWVEADLKRPCCV